MTRYALLLCFKACIALYNSGKNTDALHMLSTVCEIAGVPKADIYTTRPGFAKITVSINGMAFDGIDYAMRMYKPEVDL